MGLSRAARFDALLHRIRAEYREMPNLRLTPSEAQRLFGLEPSACHAALDALLTENFLCRTRDGLFVRAPTMHQPTPAKPKTKRPGT
jgi:hypothetical protein